MNWFLCANAHPQPRMRLFCFHYAGGAASAFRNWGSLLPKDVELHLLQMPGRENRLGEPLVTRVKTVVEALADVMQGYVDKPFAFFGHSMGALIAFELCRELRRRGQRMPEHLFVSSFISPNVPMPKEAIHLYTEDELVQKMREMNGTASAIFDNPELLQIVLPTMRADVELCETYQFYQEPPLDLPITAFGGLQDDMVNIHQLRAWGKLTASNFTLKMYPGGHFYLKEPAVERQLLELMMEELQLD
jgi:medium-chain acyl-[acyl-carrier-protein] hydrolase